MAGYITNSQINKALPAETGKVFRVVGLSKRTSTRIVFAAFGEVNFGTLSLKYAIRLEKMGFPYLERIPTKKAADYKELPAE